MTDTVTLKQLYHFTKAMSEGSIGRIYQGFDPLNCPHKRTIAFGHNRVTYHRCVACRMVKRKEEK
jgi:hypothetical protein